jgi:hypothetical protein
VPATHACTRAPSPGTPPSPLNPNPHNATPPKQIQLARWYERHGGGDAFVYLTHAWLLALFFDCAPTGPRIGVVCPTPEERDELVDAVRRGYITWHAAPFNPNYEVRGGALNPPVRRAA